MKTSRDTSYDIYSLVQYWNVTLRERKRKSEYKYTFISCCTNGVYNVFYDRNTCTSYIHVCINWNVTERRKRVKLYLTLTVQMKFIRCILWQKYTHVLVIVIIIVTFKSVSTSVFNLFLLYSGSLLSLVVEDSQCREEGDRDRSLDLILGWT